MPFVELEKGKKAGNHELFDKWRDIAIEKIRDSKSLFKKYMKDLELSHDRYTPLAINILR